MNRALNLVLLISLLLSACSRVQTGQPAGQSRSPTDGGVAGPSFAAAAAKVTDACSLTSTSLAEKLVPGASPPEREQFPRGDARSGMRNPHSRSLLTQARTSLLRVRNSFPGSPKAAI